MRTIWQEPATGRSAAAACMSLIHDCMNDSPAPRTTAPLVEHAPVRGRALLTQQPLRILPLRVVGRQNAGRRTRGRSFWELTRSIRKQEASMRMQCWLRHAAARWYEVHLQDPHLCLLRVRAIRHSRSAQVVRGQARAMPRSAEVSLRAPAGGICRRRMGGGTPGARVAACRTAHAHDVAAALTRNSLCHSDTLLQSSRHRRHACAHATSEPRSRWCSTCRTQSAGSSAMFPPQALGAVAWAQAPAAANADT